MRRFTITSLAGLLAIGVLFANASISHAQTSAKEIESNRAKVAAYIEKGDLDGAQKLVQELQSKMPKNSHAAPQNFHTFFEQISACGFYPQETRLECVMDIKQSF